LLNFEGVATAIIAVIFFKESVDRRSWAAILLIFLGSAILTFQPGEWTISLGALGVLSACIFWGIDNNFTRNISSKDPVEIVTIKGLCAGSFSLILALLLQNSMPRLFYIFSALLLGFLSYGLSTVLFVYSLRNLGAARTGALYGAAPFIGAAASFILLNEEPNILFITALPLMLAGVYLLFAEKHDHLHTHEEIEHEHPHHGDEHHTHEHGDTDQRNQLHLHRHEPLTHSHPHTPDTHHRHEH
jgi:drug/metabolite transporter (DMT)-like permease